MASSQAALPSVASATLEPIDAAMATAETTDASNDGNDRSQEEDKNQSLTRSHDEQQADLDEEDNFHPDSKYQEPYSDHASTLTLYDLHRVPRPLKKSFEKLTIPLMPSLSSEFTCPICLSYLQKTAIVMECLHRFCNDCIQKCLRLSPRKECPSCRIHIPTRRSLRLDVEFDLLLQHVLGDVNVLLKNEDARQSVLAREAKQQGSREQQQLRQRRNQADGKSVRRSIVPVVATTRVAQPPATSAPRPVLVPETDLDDMEPLPLVEIMLMRHAMEQNLPRLQKEFLTLNENVTVGLLQRFLQKKLPSSRNIMIQLKYRGTFCALQDQMTMRDVRDFFSTDSQVTILRYAAM